MPATQSQAPPPRQRLARTFSGSGWRSCERSRSWDAYHNRLKDDEPFYPVFTTIRPRTCPARIFGATSNTSAKLMSVVIWAIFCRSRSFSRRFHASRRNFCGHITESMPIRVTPRRMNGATLPGRSMPPASPQAATAPPYRVMDRTLARVVEPTASMPGPSLLGEGAPRAAELSAIDDLGGAQLLEIGGLLRPAGR